MLPCAEVAMALKKKKQNSPRASVSVSGRAFRMLSAWREHAPEVEDRVGGKEYDEKSINRDVVETHHEPPESFSALLSRTRK